MGIAEFPKYITSYNDIEGKAHTKILSKSYQNLNLDSVFHRKNENLIINKINQTRSLNKNYQNDLNTIIYDIIEGKQYIYNENNIYKPTNMVFGYNDISITDVTYELIEDDEYNLIIKGINLNESSVVFINNKKYETEYIDSNTLKVNIKTNEDKIYNICVKQMYMNSIYYISNTIELSFK